jgi:predicted transglutaminase-like protease
MLKVPWTDKITNEDILKQVNEKRRKERKDNKRIKKETIKIHLTHFKKRKVRKYSNNRQNKG